MLLCSLRVIASGFCLISLAAFGQNEDGYSANQRITRIRDLGKKDSQAIPALAQNLNDPNREIRIEAVKAIVKIGTQASLDPLIKATHDNDAEVQIRAVDGLVNFYVPGYVVKGSLTGPLTRGVRQVKTFFSSRDNQAVDPNVTVRTDVAEALGDVIRRGGSTDSRANAARAAGILRAHPALPPLLDALRSKNSEVIFECLVALQKIDDPSAGPGVSFLAHDFDDRVQATALETIGVLHSSSSAPDVRSVLRDARNMKIRRAALECLAMLGLPEDRTVFQQYIDDRDADLRTSALEGLARIREPEDTPALEQVYNEKNADPKVHLAAAFALVSEGKVDTSDFSPLRYLMENLDLRGRRDSAQAYLTELCRRDDVRKALFPLLREATKDQKLALCQALSASRNDDVVPVLSALSKDIDPDVSLAASKGLRTVQASKP
ncbi:MAG: HEAT repeat domain-containing protein [Bryobacteraceae bacterium]